MRLLILFVSISFVVTNAYTTKKPFGGLIGTDSVEATGQIVCASLPVANATIRLMSRDVKGNRALVTEELPDEQGFFTIKGTEKEIAMPEFWIEIFHYCSNTRPVVEKKYERQLDSFYYYDSHDSRTPPLCPLKRIDLLFDGQSG
ncbi:hypothetical protein AAVH_08368 [Aphelenchoides avenae]|nr:hypothetical protein AAVH_08368 [Aphelenchus avenae]